MKAPVTAPHVSANRPMPPPKPEAIFRAVSRSNPSVGPYAATIACEQENPSLKYATASSILVIGRILSWQLHRVFRNLLVAAAINLQCGRRLVIFQEAA